MNLALYGLHLDAPPTYELGPMIASAVGGIAFALLAFRDTVTRCPRSSRVGLGLFVVLAIALTATQHRVLEGITAMQAFETSVAHVDGLRLQRDVVYALFALALAAWLRFAERAKLLDPIPPATIVS